MFCPQLVPLLLVSSAVGLGVFIGVRKLLMDPSLKLNAQLRQSPIVDNKHKAERYNRAHTAWKERLGQADSVVHGVQRPPSQGAPVRRRSNESEVKRLKPEVK